MKALVSYNWNFKTTHYKIKCMFYFLLFKKNFLNAYFKKLKMQRKWWNLSLDAQEKPIVNNLFKFLLDNSKHVGT